MLFELFNCFRELYMYLCKVIKNQVLSLMLLTFWELRNFFSIFVISVLHIYNKILLSDFFSKFYVRCIGDKLHLLVFVKAS